MGEFRQKVVVDIFLKLVRNGDKQISIDDLKEMYNPEKHPDFLIGKKSSEEVLAEFIDTFEEYCYFVVQFLLNH